MGPKAGLDRCGKIRRHQYSIPGPSSPQPVPIPTELPGLLFDIYPLMCQRHQTIIRLLSSAATAGTFWRLRELNWSDQVYSAWSEVYSLSFKHKRSDDDPIGSKHFVTLIYNKLVIFDGKFCY